MNLNLSTENLRQEGMFASASQASRAFASVIEYLRQLVDSHANAFASRSRIFAFNHLAQRGLVAHCVMEIVYVEGLVKKMKKKLP